MLVKERSLVRAVTALAALIAILSPDSLAAQGPPVNTGSHVPVALWFIGAFVLAGAIVYGIMRNRRRSGAEKQITEQATRDNYRRESQSE